MQARVVERRRSRMLVVGGSPARPRQAVIIALARTLARAQRDQIEVLLMIPVQFEALRRLAGIAGAPATAVDLAQQILGRRHAVLDLDVHEQPIGKTELLGEAVDDLLVLLGLANR